MRLLEKSCLFMPMAEKGCRRYGKVLFEGASMNQGAAIAVIGTFDSKGEEHLFTEPFHEFHHPFLMTGGTEMAAFAREG